MQAGPLAIAIGLVALTACAHRDSAPAPAAVETDALLAEAEAQPQSLPQRLRELALSNERTLLAELRDREAERKASPEFTAYSEADLLRVLLHQQKVIYGTDDRREVQSISDPTARRASESVVSLFLDTAVVDNGDGTSTLVTRPFGEAYDLCESEAFRTQPAGAYCSGFLVSGDMIATAGHCAGTTEFPAERIRFVFGFRWNGSSGAVRIANADVYAGVAIVGRDLSPTAADWAVVRVDRTVTGRAPLAVRSTGKVADDATMYVIGHPCGLPAKHAGNARVRTNQAATHFVCNLDTYGGNSGSPVFDERTHVVEGVLVRGETDFVRSGDCNTSLKCPDTGCRGEDVTRTTLFSSLIPAQ